jgi:protein-disulfide isomerase-like protein with CxxC motif
MKHVFSVAGVGLAAAFVVVFFTGRVDSKHLTAVAPRVGMQFEELDALVPRIAAQTGATTGTARRVVYLLACSGIPTSATIEGKALEAATITEKQRMTARQAAVVVLSGTTLEAATSPLKDC